MEDEKLNYYREKASEDDGVNDNKEIKEYTINLLDQMKDVRIKKIFMLRYFTESKQKNTWQKIGEKMDVSTQTAINLHEKGRKMLATKFKSKQFSELI
jgi:DNA-directed RNA polymerase specialized sigma subunit